MKVGAYKVWALRLSKNKMIEFQISRWPGSNMFAIGLWFHRGDHKGIDLSTTIFWHEFRLDFYDRRHEEDM